MPTLEMLVFRYLRDAAWKCKTGSHWVQMVSEARSEDEIPVSGERLQLKSEQSKSSGWGEGKMYQSKEVKKIKCFQENGANDNVKF